MSLNKLKGQVLYVASYEKTIQIIDSVTAGIHYGDGHEPMYRPRPIWRSNDVNDFFMPLPHSDTLYVSKMNEPGSSGRGEPNSAVFFPDFDQIPYGKKILKIELYFYAKNNFPYPVADLWSIILPQVTIGWNKITFTSWNVEPSTKKRYLKISSYNHVPYEWLEIDSHTGLNKPYAVITYEDVPPKAPSSLYPSNITLDARGIIRFNWKHNSEEKTQQKGFTLQYSINSGSTWTTVNRTTANQYYDMPADTLPTTGTILWRVKTIDSNGLESPYAQTTFNTAIVPQKAPTLVSPLSGYLDGSKPIVFKWNFVGGTSGDKQSKYDLQYSVNQGVTWTTVTLSSNAQEHTMLENTLQSGNIYWRVRTYNQFGDVSPYSEIGSFYVINSPPIPQILEVTNSGRPTIRWNSVEQQIYEIQILHNNKVIFQTGKIPSSNDRSYKLGMFLDDGEYLVRLRVTNEYDLTSPWAEYMFVLSTEKPEKPSIELFNGEYSVTIKTDETTLKTLVYRDNKLIGEMIEGYFEDYTGENRKEYQYFIRVVNEENDNFNDSDIRIGRCKFKGNTLALANNPKKFIKLKLGYQDIAKKSSTVGNTGSLIYFDGRKYPVVEFSEFKEYAKTSSFFIRNKEELNKLIELIDKKETVIYRDTDGEVIYGAILNINYEKNLFGYEVNFTITKTGDAYD